MTNFERYCLRQIGENKETIKRFINNGGLNWNHSIDYIQHCLDEIKMYKQFVKEEQAKDSVVERFNDYIRPWDYDNGNAPEEDGMFYRMGEPTQEYLAHMKKKERRRRKFTRK